MRKIGVALSPVEGLTIEEQLKVIKEIGFEAVGISTPVLDKRAACKKAVELGLVIDHIHGRFRGINSIWQEGAEGDAFIDDLMAELDLAAECGVEKIVVHLDSGFDAPFVTDIGKERLDRLMAHSAKTGVKLAYENIRKLANLAYVMERYPEAGYCYDSGHEVCYTDSKYDFLGLFGKRMLCTHIHDNSGYPNDDHLIPYDGVLDFDGVIARFKKSGYQGTLLTESIFSNEKNERQKELYGKLSYEEWCRRLYAAMVKMRKAIDE